MQKLSSWSMLVSPFVLLAACGDANLGVDKRDGGAGAGTGGSGSGGILGTGGSTPGTGGILGNGGIAFGTGGGVPGNGGVTGVGGAGSGGRSNGDAGGRDPGDGPDDALDASYPDAPIDGLVMFDGVPCQAPKVWRYQQPGCGADAHPVCGSSQEDACLRYVCGCEGEILEGCDYYTKPWRSKGLCPEMCLSPTQYLDIMAKLNYIPSGLKGCACSPTSDAPQCMQNVGLFSCVGDAWTLDRLKTCAELDAGSDGQVVLDAPADSTVAPGCDVAAARAAMAALGLVPTGSAETLNDTLPFPISGPNWGLKSTACQDGGYDISGLAGQTVCLVKQPITQACAQAPYLAWAVMSGGNVKCVYETNDANPGVYAVNGYVCS